MKSSRAKTEKFTRRIL
ncbi:hypothetical protein [Porphyromonas gulae]